MIVWFSVLFGLATPSGFFLTYQLKIMSQRQAIKQHLESGRPITPLEALSEYGCLRLAARISDLRDAGMNIRTDIVELNDKRFAKYTLS